MPLCQRAPGRLGGGTDAFVTQVDLAQSSLGWSTYLGGSSDEGKWFTAILGLGLLVTTLGMMLEYDVLSEAGRHAAS